jgi:hypothetical protein
MKSVQSEAKMNEKEGGSLREGTNDLKPTDEMKLKAWEFMKKHALPRRRTEERR